MKNLILFAVILCFISSSCKKSYVCSCSSTLIYYDNSNGTFGKALIQTTEKPFSEKMTSKQAKAACDNEQVVIQSNLINWDTDNGNYTLHKGESIITDCSIN